MKLIFDIFRSSVFDRQVRLPRNQLFVTRVTGRTHLADLLHTVCNEKALDPRHYELRHPGIFAILVCRSLCCIALPRRPYKIDRADR